MNPSPNEPRVTRLVRLRQGPLRAAFSLLFSLAIAMPIAYGVLLVWSLSRPAGLADPTAWTVLTGAYFLAVGSGLTLRFVLTPDVELYTHGLVIRVPGQRFILPWEAVLQARETRGPTLLWLGMPLTPLHRMLALLLGGRSGRAVILLPRRHRRYPQARAILRDYLPDDRFIAS